MLSLQRQPHHHSSVERPRLFCNGPVILRALTQQAQAVPFAGCKVSLAEPSAMWPAPLHPMGLPCRSGYSSAGGAGDSPHFQPLDPEDAFLLQPHCPSQQQVVLCTYSSSPELIASTPVSSRKAIAKSSLQHMVAQPNPALALRSDSERQIRSTVDWSVSCSVFCWVLHGMGSQPRSSRLFPG